MSSDYEAITKYNERQLGLDTASRKTQICMYSDSTHFVYEILQNADDYGATEVVFKLTKDEIVIEHNGLPFSEENVKAITYFGKSTSKEDLVKTGRFGVGFKSVFAFTATPIIISGHEHFQIYGLYRIREYPYPEGLPRSRTRIILPFNHESEQPDYVEDLMLRKVAYSKISSRLTKLNMNTLLFTRNIQEIRWMINGGSGHYLREDDTNGNTRWTTITDGEKLNKYLVFSLVPTWKNQEYKTVDIAFAIDSKNQLSQVEDFLYVLFPTTQETHLQFIINGPFRTNPSRETISEDDHFNLHLMKEICSLMRELLPQLREMGLLTTQFLSVLPNGNDKLRDFYTPLLDAIVKTFHKQELVPTDDNQYAASGDVLQCPALIREVITKKELPFFIGRRNACWAKGVQQNSRADYFLYGLGIQQWGWKQLQKALEDKFGKKSYPWSAYYTNNDDNAWLAERPDSWLQKLYILLANAIRKNDCDDWTLKNCSIIRVREDGEESHVVGSKAYFPKRGYRGLPQVKRAILRGRNSQATKKIQESLIALGVSEIGDDERIDLLLETYYGEESAKVTEQQHLQHMQSFIKWWKKEKNARKFKDYAIFRTSQKSRLKEAMECFLESPLRKTGLRFIYSNDISGITSKSRLWSGYRKLSAAGFNEFAVACGVDDQLSIKQRSCWNHPQGSEMRRGLWYARETYTGKDIDYYIPQLEKLLNCRKREISRLVWNTVRKADPKVLCAEYRPNQQYETRIRKSSLVLQLSETEWIPDKRGRLHKPCDITKEKLHPDFKYDNRNGWLDEIGFGENAKRASEEYKIKNQQAKSLGFSSADEAQKMAELFKLLKESGKAPEDLISQLKSNAKKGQPAFPTRISTNPARRQERLAEQMNDAPEKEYEQRNRSVRTTSNAIDKVTYLKNAYTNDDDQMVCQICKEEMPFRKRDGDYYFEAVEALSRDHFAREHEAQFLALCPLCAAMYNEFVKHDEGAMASLKNTLINSEDAEVPLQLGDLDTSIRFVESHFLDIKTIIDSQE